MVMRPAHDIVTTIQPMRMLPPAQSMCAERPSLAQLWAWLEDVSDPEIPVVSVVDLGIVRSVAWSDDEEDTAIITVTPTYSGCPATEVISRQIREELSSHGVRQVSILIQLSPAWTTDWLTGQARQKLKEYGIAPPTEAAAPPTYALSAGLFALVSGAQTSAPPCPRCDSTRTETVSRFGSTPCKSLHRCLDCLEPFDHFKCH